MTAAAIVHIGPRSAAETGRHLTADDLLGRWDDWRRRPGVTVPADVLAAEKHTAAAR